MILGDQCIAQESSPREFPAVERKPKELREARLTRTVEAGDPTSGKLWPALLVELATHRRKQTDELLVDPVLRGPRIVRGVAAGHDVLLDLALELVRFLSLKVDDRRNRPG